MRSKDIAGAAVLAALASLLTLSGASTLLRMPPPFSYLVFDPSEIPSLIAYFSFNFRVSFLVAVIHFIFLLFRGEFIPIGPFMKFSAVISMLIGFHVAFKMKRKEIFCVMFSSLFRALVMTVVNIIVLITLFRDLILSVSSNYTIGLLLILLVTAIYNVIHVALFNYPVARAIVYQIERIKKLKY